MVAAQQEAVGAAGVDVPPDDLACIVDALCNGADGGQGIIEGGEGTAAVEKAVEGVAEVKPDDLTRIVDASCLAEGGQGIVHGGVGIDRHDTGSSLIVERRSES
jgi:hypothetical protein